MSYVDSQLLPGESVVYRSKLHWRIFLAPGFFSFLFLIGGIALASRSMEAALGLLVVAVALLVPPFIKRANSEFAVTNRKRLVVKLGFFTTRSVELLLSKVEAISVDQGLLEKNTWFWRYRRDRQWRHTGTIQRCRLSVGTSPCRSGSDDDVSALQKNLRGR